MKKKICFCIDSLKFGGAERLLVEVINNWNFSDDLYLCTLNNTNDFKDKIQWNKIKYYHCFLSGNRWDIIKEAAKFCRNNNIQIVNTHLEHSNKCFGMGAAITGATVFTTVHSINIYSIEPFFRQLIAKKFYNLIPKSVIAISDSVKKYLVEFGINEKKIVTIPNSINISYIREKYRNIHLTQELRLATLGRLEHVKGLDILLEALSIVKKRETDWRLDIVGDGSQMQSLKKIAFSLGIMDNVTFHGMQKDPLAIIQGTSLLCMPSRREGLPISLLEGLAMGIPAIVSDIGYLPVLIKDGLNGFVVPVENVTMLAEKILAFNELGLAERNRMSNEAILASQKYDIGKCVNQYSEIFSKAMRIKNK